MIIKFKRTSYLYWCTYDNAKQSYEENGQNFGIHFDYDWIKMIDR